VARKRPSPWAAFSEEQEASARAYDDLCYETRLLFQDAQHEAYEQWVARDEAIEQYENKSAAPAKEVDLVGFKKNDLLLLILTLLREKEMYGYQLSQAVNQLAKGQYELQPTVLYPLLYGLEECGVIEGQWRENPEGPRRKYYKLTTWGIKILSLERSVFDTLVASVLGNK
jgi:PadR family transcriptional regulator PadR